MLEASETASGEASVEVEAVLGEVLEKAGVELQSDCRVVAALLGPAGTVAIELGSGSAAGVQVRSEEVEGWWRGLLAYKGSQKVAKVILTIVIGRLRL